MINLVMDTRKRIRRKRTSAESLLYLFLHMLSLKSPVHEAPDMSFLYWVRDMMFPLRFSWALELELFICLSHSQDKCTKSNL